MRLEREREDAAACCACYIHRRFVRVYFPNETRESCLYKATFTYSVLKVKRSNFGANIQISTQPNSAGFNDQNGRPISTFLSNRNTSRIHLVFLAKISTQLVFTIFH